MTDAEDLPAALEAVAEHERLSARVQRAEFRLGEATSACAKARFEHGREAAEVQALESISPGMIWAALRGERASELSRAQAEEQAADYVVAKAEDEVASARAELEASRAARAALGDVAERRERALAVEDERRRAAGGPGSEELAELAQEAGTARSQLVEVEEALTAAVAAEDVLAEAWSLLGKARDWANYDTFFQGGLVTDAMKYDRVQGAERLLRQADHALRRLATELADIGLTGTTEVDVRIDDLTRTFDMWFDNIFSDWSVRDRIVGAHDRTGTVLQAVRATRATLTDRRTELIARVEAAVRRREDLLVPR